MSESKRQWKKIMVHPCMIDRLYIDWLAQANGFDRMGHGSKILGNIGQDVIRMVIEESIFGNDIFTSSICIVDDAFSTGAPLSSRFRQLRNWTIRVPPLSPNLNRNALLSADCDY